MTTLAKLRANRKGRRGAMAGSGDMKAHEATYRNITRLLFWGGIHCFVIAFIVIWLIS